MFASPFVATKYDPDPYRRPNQKKQGRENKNKARGGSNWSPRNNKRNGKPSYPRKHTPGKDHRKYSIPLIIPLLSLDPLQLDLYYLLLFLTRKRSNIP